MKFISAASVLLSCFLATTTTSATPLEPRQANCGTYTVPNVAGGFKTRTFIDFSKYRASDKPADILWQHDLYMSDWDVTIDPKHLTHTFTPNNIAFVDGALDLKVDRYTGGKVIGAEMGTTFSFKYGSVRTYLKSSTTPGVCEGNFLYADRWNEVDWETLTSTIDVDSPTVPKGIWATNQALNDDTPKVSKVFEFDFNPRTAFHEYRIDWTADATRFYIDGVYKGELTSSVPELAGPWIWNVWSNGDPYWSAGPPTADSHTQIRSIEIYRDYTPTRTGTICPV